MKADIEYCAEQMRIATMLSKEYIALHRKLTGDLRALTATDERAVVLEAMVQAERCYREQTARYYTALTALNELELKEQCVV